jgi:hypothetical protein
MGRIFIAQCIVGCIYGYLYCFLKIKTFTKYGRDYFPTPKIFELIIEKYLILE